MTGHIVVLDPVAGRTFARMSALLPPGFTMSHGTERSEAHLQSIIAGADYAISGQIAVPAAVLGAAKRLKLLHKWGVGTDNLDLAAAKALGIKVARTTGSNSVPVAEFTLGLMIATLRHLAWAHAELQAGHWRGGHLPGDAYQLSGKTVGIVGFGAIGRTVARLLQGFACPVLYHTPRRLDPAEEAALGVSYATMPELLAAADVVSLHCPLTEQTTGLIDAAALVQMKRSAVLINVARGGVVIEADLADALRRHVIHGAATDVFATEPVPPDNPLLHLPNCIVTPHIAAGCADTFEPTIRQMFDNFARVGRGEPVPARDLVVG
jgi:D-3-phosphoglycerate dehydrogenase